LAVGPITEVKGFIYLISVVSTAGSGYVVGRASKVDHRTVELHAGLWRNRTGQMTLE